MISPVEKTCETIGHWWLSIAKQMFYSIVWSSLLNLAGSCAEHVKILIVYFLCLEFYGLLIAFTCRFKLTLVYLILFRFFFATFCFVCGMCVCTQLASFSLIEFFRCCLGNCFNAPIDAIKHQQPCSEATWYALSCIAHAEKSFGA